MKKPIQCASWVFLFAGVAASAAGPELHGRIVDKSGTQSGRRWDLEIASAANHTVSGVQIEAVHFTQTSLGGGAACTPAITNPPSLPVALGSLLPGGSTRASLVIDFTGCADRAHFTVEIELSGSGGARGVIRRNNDSR